MYTIVIADDERTIRKSLIHKVDWEAIGFQVVGEAENGIEALELVEKLEPDLLLSDIKMPFVTGIELARQVREVRPMTQIAFLSGYDDFTFAQQAIQYNIISYMLKPITLEKITEELILIREKMEKKFAEFLSTDVIHVRTDKSNLLLSLLMDEYSPEVWGEEPKKYEQTMILEAMQCGLLETNAPEQMHYVVMTMIITDENGKNVTSAANVKSIDGILGKYFRYSSVFVQKKIVSLLMGTRREIEKYLSIAVDDIVQNVDRIMKCNMVIGVSRTVQKITGTHSCYHEAMKAMSYSAGKKSGINFISDIEQRQRSGEVSGERAVKIINEKYMNPELSLSDVSSEIGITPNYLSALIKREKGSSFKDLLTSKRLDVAKELLSNTGLKVWEIAEKCGYSEPHYFSYCFKKYTGESPNAYRRKFEEQKADDL